MHLTGVELDPIADRPAATHGLLGCWAPRPSRAKLRLYTPTVFGGSAAKLVPVPHHIVGGPLFTFCAQSRILSKKTWECKTNVGKDADLHTQGFVSMPGLHSLIYLTGKYGSAKQTLTRMQMRTHKFLFQRLFCLLFTFCARAHGGRLLSNVVSRSPFPVAQMCPWHFPAR